MEKGQFTLYLNGPDRSDLDITFEVQSACFEHEDGSCRNLLTKPVSINSRQIAAKQLLLGEMDLAKGRYIGLKITVSGAKIKTVKGISDLALPQGSVDIPVNATLEANEAAAVFLVWNADASVESDYLFNPVLDAQIGKADLSSFLLFVSNEGSDNISVINRSQDKVVSVLKAGKRPRGLVTSMQKNSSRLYVANYGANTISLIDPIAQRTDEEVLIRFGKGPGCLVPAILNDGREVLYIVNQDSNNLSIFDTMTNQETGRINVGDAPVAIATDPPLEEFEHSFFFTPSDIQVMREYRQNYFNLYVVNSRSNNVSVLKASSSTGEIEQQSVLNVDFMPVAITIDSQRGKIYIANRNSEKISVFSIMDVIKGSASVSRLGNFGLMNRDVLPDPDLNRLYILKEMPGQIMIVNIPGEQNGRAQFTLLPILNVLPVEKNPRSIFLDEEGRKIYVVNTGSDSVSVINKTSVKMEKRISVGRNPYAITRFSQF